MSWVYFIREGEDGPIKIGSSGNPRRRLAALQTANAKPLRLVGAYLAGHTAETEEHKLHAEFSRYRLHGEWFSPNSVLLSLISTLGPDTCDVCRGIVTSAPPPQDIGPCFVCQMGTVA